jgi:hypothetical protein
MPECLNEMKGFGRVGRQPRRVCAKELACFEVWGCARRGGILQKGSLAGDTTERFARLLSLVPPLAQLEDIPSLPYLLPALPIPKFIRHVIFRGLEFTS